MATEVERLAVLVEANTSQMERALKRLEKITDQSFKRQAASVAALDARMKKIAGTISRGAGAIVAAFGTRAIAAGIVSAVKLGEAIGDTAEKLGITAEAYQELSFVADQNGTSQESLTAAFRGLTKILGEAERGSKSARAEFTAIGLSFDDVRGKSPSDVFELLLDRIGKISDPLQRNAELMKFFGKSGTEMAQMAALGARGIDQIREQARKLGVVLSNDEIAKLQDAGDKIGIIGSAGQAAGERMAIAFIPALDALEKLVTSEGFQKGLADTAGALGQIVAFITEHPALMRVLGAAATGAMAGRVFGGVGAGIGGAGFAGGQILREVFGDLPNPFASSQPQGRGYWPPAMAPGSAAPPLPPPIEIGDHGGPGAPVVPHFTTPEQEKAQKEIDDVIKSLNFESEQLGRTDREQEIYNKLKEAGVTINSRWGKEIASATGELYDQRKALDAVNEAAQFAGSTLYDVFDGLLLKGKSVNDVLQNMLGNLAEAALQASLLGQGPLAGLFGTSPATSGGLGGIFGLLFGKRAGGGKVQAGMPYLVGERHPEIFVPDVGGRIDPRRGAGGMMLNFTQNLTVQGSSGDPRSDARYIQALRNEMKSAAQEVIDKNFRLGGRFAPVH